jgi:hypothetical protein
VSHPRDQTQRSRNHGYPGWIGSQARSERLLTQELSDELLVYDLDRHRAHSLNRTAALVWRHCDGRTTVAEMAALLQRELSLPADEDAVWMALRRLDKAHLLQAPITLPADAVRCSRREMVRKLGTAAGLALVGLIAAPRAAQALSCRPGGAACTADSQCCSGKCLGSNTCKS